jgi:hypothetical protein
VRAAAERGGHAEAQQTLSEDIVFGQGGETLTTQGCTVSARSVRVEEARLVSDERFEASLPDQRLGRWFLVRAVECDAEGCEWVARGQGAVDRERRVARVGAAPAALALTTVFGCGELQGGAR